MTDVTPVTLIGGYLGAGKTTLVNHLLRNAGGRRLAVLVNEFGALPIDADLIVAREDNLISISGGCICCSFGSDLVAALIDLKQRGNPIDHLLIETSGVALPGSIVQSLALLPGLVLDGVIVLADAETIEARAGDRYMGDTVLGQLTHADIVLLNKTDLVSQQRADTIVTWLAATVPGARVLPVRNADLPLDVIIGQHSGRQAVEGSMAPSEHHEHQTQEHQTDDYTTLSLEIDSRCDVERLARNLADARLGLLRAKGFLRGLDGKLATVHIVGRRVQVEPAPAWVEGPGRLVCIGLATEINRDAILAAVEPLAAFVQEPPDSILTSR
jgi:G3E family GTPase